MTWQTPKTDWQAADVVSKDDFNRIEGNIQELQNTKETPAGAQAKANTALNSAKQYTDQEVAEVSQALDAHANASAPHAGHAAKNHTHSDYALKSHTHSEYSLTTHNHSGVYEPVLSADRKRKITISTSDPSGGSDGDIWIKY